MDDNHRRSKRLKLIEEKKIKNKEDHINDLPLELLLMIFEYFHQIELNTLREVCKNWYSIIKENLLQNRLFVDKYEPTTLKANSFEDVNAIAYCPKTDLLAVAGSKSIKFYKNLKFVSLFTKPDGGAQQIKQNSTHFFAINHTGIITKISKSDLKWAGKLGKYYTHSGHIFTDNHYYRTVEQYFCPKQYLEKYTLNGKYLTCVDLERRPTTSLVGPNQSLYLSFFPGKVIRYEGHRKRTLYSHVDHIIEKMKYYKEDNIIVTVGSYTHVDIWSTDFIKKKRISVSIDFHHLYITNFFYNHQTKDLLVVNQEGYVKDIYLYSGKKFINKKLINNDYRHYYFIDKYGRFVLLDRVNPQFLVY